MPIILLGCTPNRLVSIVKRFVHKSTWKVSQTDSKPLKDIPDETKAVKPFTDIPGPKGPFGFGSIVNYFSFVGKLKYIIIMLFIRLDQ